MVLAFRRIDRAECILLCGKLKRDLGVNAKNKEVTGFLTGIYKPLTFHSLELYGRLHFWDFSMLNRRIKVPLLPNACNKKLSYAVRMTHSIYTVLVKDLII